MYQTEMQNIKDLFSSSSATRPSSTRKKNLANTNPLQNITGACQIEHIMYQMWSQRQRQSVSNSTKNILLKISNKNFQLTPTTHRQPESRVRIKKTAHRPSFYPNFV